MKSSVSALILASLAASTAMALPPEQAAQWSEDLTAYQAGLESHHIDLYHHISREEFTAHLEDIRANLEHVESEDQIIASLMALTHQIGDGHTSIPLWDRGYHRFPLRFKILDGKAYVIEAPVEQSALLGSELIAINDVSYADARARLDPIMPFVENAQSQNVRSSFHLSTAELLHALHITETAEVARYTLEKDGVRHSVSVNAQTRDSLNTSSRQSLSYRAPLPDGALSAGRISFTLLENGRAAYFRFDGYPNFEDMLAFAQDSRARIEASPADTLIVDLRENFGGDFYLGLVLASQLNLLDQINWKNKVYVLTGEVTFSAAMSNAAQFSDILNARRVGTPTGANPCGYQDMGQFNLPHSHLIVTYSKRAFCFAPSVNDALQPDIVITPNLDDYLSTTDRALAWVLADSRSH